MIFVDSNIPMSLVGAAHPNKDAARRLLEQAIAGGERLVTDAEVLQEILHRYHTIRRPDAIQPAFDALLGIVDEVYPVELHDVEHAKALMLGIRTLSARDVVHAAVMKRRGLAVPSPPVSEQHAGSVADLAERDRVERERGAGGHATVYLAEDLRREHRLPAGR